MVVRFLAMKVATPLEKHIVMQTGNFTIPGMNYLFEMARTLNLGQPTGVYGHPPDPFRQYFTEWGVICEKGIVCSREEADTVPIGPPIPK